MTILEISQANILIWVLFGLVVGSLVHLLDPGEIKGGIFMTIGLGILGAVAGGLLSSVLFNTAISGINFQNFAIAVIGGIILAVISRLIFRNRNHIKTINMKLR